MLHDVPLTMMIAREPSHMLLGTDLLLKICSQISKDPAHPILWQMPFETLPYHGAESSRPVQELNVAAKRMVS